MAKEVHPLPQDMREVLKTHQDAATVWRSLTPLAQTEWICWVISVKKVETRREHLLRFVQDLKRGKRRPCCWIGCIHRTDKAISPSVRGILAKRTKKS